MRARTNRRNKAGFTLMEVMIATVVLAVGLLSLAAMLANGLAYMNMSQYDYIAQEKAMEAVESIFTARDMGAATWGSICNVGGGPACIFQAGPQQMCDPGADGIIGTADDNCAALPDAILLPNAGNTFNPPVRVALSNFTRTIAIAPVPGVANLSQIQVTVTYTSGRFRRSYTLYTNISNFS
ncbi:MAG TPA: prepilin-type N-terminal cleavage/methylation domain-containing protein [Candidatus Limnocylindrales bacterium]|nr:prepilin-type N-terminal cleavage/methylation domain-containing protein [Candidatus Limnocylindrales bacterium]